jgi:hypothetical protein
MARRAFLEENGDKMGKMGTVKKKIEKKWEKKLTILL